MLRGGEGRRARHQGCIMEKVSVPALHRLLQIGFGNAHEGSLGFFMYHGPCASGVEEWELTYQVPHATDDITHPFLCLVFINKEIISNITRLSTNHLCRLDYYQDSSFRITQPPYWILFP